MYYSNWFYMGLPVNYLFLLNDFILPPPTLIYIIPYYEFDFFKFLGNTQEATLTQMFDSHPIVNVIIKH